MKTKGIYRLLQMAFCVAIFNVLFFKILGQNYENGVIIGTVRDSESNEVIPLANVIVKGTIIGTTTDINGMFKLKNLKKGDYEIQVLHLGYEPYTEKVSVKAEEPTFITIKLKPTTLEMKEVLIYSERPKSAASSKEIRLVDLEVKQNRSTQDLLQRVPGLIITQHQGGGKAEQILIRGFDCDHGTDINILADGIPVNMVTHAHGQGYADTHFLIAETIDDIEVYKGPYFAEFGDFSTAATVVFKTKDIIDNNFIRFEVGEFNTYKTTLLYQIKDGGAQQNAYFAGQYYTTDGPFINPQNFKRLNIFAKYFNLLSAKSKISLSFSSYTSCWDASGQIPTRAVEQGIISRFGAIDPLEGGTTGRQNVNVEYTLKGTDQNTFVVQSYFSKYNFKLFSNFTFFLFDPDDGDMIEQKDNRDIYGLNVKYSFYKELINSILKTSFGGGFRADNINVALYHSPNRVFKNAFADDIVYQRNFYLFASEDFIFSEKFKINAGLRADYFTFNVDNKPINDSVYMKLPHASGFEHKVIASPKFNIIFSPLKHLDLFFNAGTSFHSNDARCIIISKAINEIVKYYQSHNYSEEAIDSILISKNYDPQQKNVTTIPRCIGSELGLRTNIKNKVLLSSSFWYLFLEKEFVYAGDGGFTELNDPTKRIGVDLELRWKIYKWIWTNIDFNFSNARIIGASKGNDFVPLSPRIVSTGGISLINFKNITFDLQYRYVSDRPGNEDFSIVAPGHLIFNSGISYKFKQFQLFAFVENIFNVDWNEAQFATETKLKHETTPITEICFTPGNPRNFQFGISFNF
ncbi:MAG: TonB-dependent receptor [Bacteroidales bacterium]|nr:TonB-dependent receptor [Bacteroidales bacterium]